VAADGERKGYWLSDRHLKRRRGLDVLTELYETDVNVNVATDDHRKFLFSYRRRGRQFEFIAQDDDANAWLTSTYLDRWARHSHGGAYSLEEWFRRSAHTLVVYGEAFYALDFTPNGGDYLAFDEPRWLPIETMRPEYWDGDLVGFRQRYSRRAEDERVRGARFEFEPEEVVWLKWPASLPPGREGASPVRTVIADARAIDRFREWSLLSSYSATYPEDKSLPVERARYADHDAEWRKMREHEASLFAALGVPQAFHRSIPMTAYFVAWELCQFGERVALLRDYLISQFNAQVMAVWAAKNSLPEVPRLSPLDYPSPGDWRSAFLQYEDGTRSFDELRDMFFDKAS